MRYAITDDLWAALGPLVEPVKRNRPGQKPDLPDRLFVEAVLYGARTGIPVAGPAGRVRGVGRGVRPVPPVGEGASGRLRALFELLTDRPAFGEVRRVRIDATTVRAHQHTVGARRGKKARPANVTGGTEGVAG